MKRHLIGTSLSMCLHDIMEGKVNEKEVLLIITNTRHPFESDRSHVWDNRRWTHKESRVLDRLWRQGRLHQPREVSAWYEQNVELNPHVHDPDHDDWEEHVLPRKDYPYTGDRWFTVWPYVSGLTQ